MRTRPAGRGAAASAVPSASGSARADEVAAVGRTGHRRRSDPVRSARGQLLRAGAREHGQGAGRGQAELAAPGQRRAGEPAGIGVEDGVEHLVVGQPGLHQQPPAAGAAAEQAGGAGQQGQRLLGGPVAGREQLVVEVEEGHHVGPRHPVQHGLGADVDRGGRASGVLAVAPVTSTTGRPAAASSSSRSRADARPQHDQRATSRTPGTRRGRSVPQRRQRSRPSSVWATAASQRSQRSSARHDAAGQQPGPAGRVEHADHPSGPGRAGGSISGLGDQRASSTARRRGGRRPRGCGQPARSSLRRRRRHAVAGPVERLERRARATPAAQGTPARRARSTATSRACQVGARSSCSASSCSSSTTTAARPAPAPTPRPGRPTTTSTPPAAAAQSRGHDGDGQPGAAQAGAEQPAPGRPTGSTTSVGPGRGRGQDDGRAGRPLGGRRTTASAAGQQAAPRRRRPARAGRPSTAGAGQRRHRPRRATP